MFSIIIMYMNLLCFLLLNLRYNNHSFILYNNVEKYNPPSILDFYKNYISGSDLRSSDNYQENQTNFDKILNNHQKKEWLNKLESKNFSQDEKAEFIKNEIESAYRSFNIRAGGLMDDWLR